MSTRRRVTSPRQERSRETIAAILNAAERAIHESGPADVSMRSVARAAAVSNGTLYQYFPNKESLLHAVEQRSLEVIFLGLGEQLARWPELPPFERTVRLVEHLVRELTKAIARHGLSPIEDLPPETRAQRLQFVEWLGASMRAAFTSMGIELLPTNVTLAATLVFQIVMNLARAALVFEGESLETGEYGREVGRIVARYLIGTRHEPGGAGEPAGDVAPGA